jgi:hypothetical protein
MRERSVQLDIEIGPARYLERQLGEPPRSYPAALRPARGIVFAIAAAIPLWGLIGAAVWWLA